MNPKKIAILYAGAQYWGGVETYIEQLFINVDKKKLDLTLISLGNWELNEKLSTLGYKTKVIDKKWYQLGVVGELSKYLISEDYDLIASQGMVANFYGRLTSKRTNIPNLITIHSDYKFDYHGLKEFLYWLTFRIFESYTKRYIVVSKFLQKEAIKLGVNKSKITVIYNGVMDPFNHDGQEVFIKANNNEKIIFGSLGRLHYKKGYQGLIKAAALIKDENFKIYIWGDGDEKPELSDLIKLNLLTDTVFLKGFTTDIKAALKEIDIYIQPSLEEGFGITVAEGMYASKPIIVTPAGSLPELITDGKTGIITEGFGSESIAAAMKTLIENPEMAKKLGIAARQEALTRFGLENWISEIEKAYIGASK